MRNMRVLTIKEADGDPIAEQKPSEHEEILSAESLDGGESCPHTQGEGEV